LSSEAETNSIEDEDESEDEDLPSPIFHCDESKKPVEERECFTDRNCGDPAWFGGEWSEVGRKLMISGMHAFTHLQI
jgi:hypothetical protein